MTPETKAAIVGISGPALLAEEAALFRAHPPAGIILFARNILDGPRLAALMAELRRVLPPHAVFMVDQEGGRVARLRPPSWRAHPPGAELRHNPPRVAERRLIGLDCAEAGFNTVAAPGARPVDPGRARRHRRSRVGRGSPGCGAPRPSVRRGFARRRRAADRQTCPRPRAGAGRQSSFASDRGGEPSRRRHSAVRAQR
jgi:hypothetical protein